MSAKRTRYHRRGWWSLLWAGVCFCAAQAACGILLDNYWLGLRFPQAAATLAQARSLPHSPDVLCLGSSRLGGAFRPAEITAELRRRTGDDGVAAFNACIEAGDPITADFMLDHLLRQGTRPSTIIVEVSPETLAERDAWMHLHVNRQFRWRDVPEVWLDVCRTRNLPRFVTGRLLPLHAYRRELCGAARDSWPEAWTLRRSKRKRAKAGVDSNHLPFIDTQRVTGKYDKDLPLWEQRLIWLPMIRGWLKDYRLGGTAARSLERLVDRCRAEGMEVILVGAPVSSPHRQLYTPLIEAEYNAFLACITQRPGCRYLDWRDRFADELFVDNHHLFREGALEFSHAIVEELLNQPVAQARAEERMPRR